MLKLDFLKSEDVKQAAAIERRRRFEDERRKRIFNARTRMIGVDVEELNRQLAEKKQRKDDEKKLELSFAEKQLQDAMLSIECEKHEKEIRKKMLHEINEFRSMYQRKEDSREYDLNDPNALRKEIPARLCDDDPRCGISSVQKFEGEDLASDVRKKLQIEQTRAYLEQQIKERKKGEIDSKLSEEVFYEALMTRDKRAVELELMERECRNSMVYAIQDFNRAMIEKQKFDKNLKKRQETEDNYAEIYNAVTGDFLTENPYVAEGNFGPDRPIAYLYKGMTPEQREVFRRQQLLQIEENKAKRDEAKKHKDYWDEYMIQNDLESVKLEIDYRKKIKELNKRQAEYNLGLATEKKAYNEYMNRVIDSTPTDAFYEQFNTTTR